MSENEYTAAVTACYLAARLLAQHDLPSVARAIALAETTGPLIDPTLYRAKSGAMREDLAAINAAGQLRKIGLRLEGDHAGAK